VSDQEKIIDELPKPSRLGQNVRGTWPGARSFSTFCSGHLPASLFDPASFWQPQSLTR